MAITSDDAGPGTGIRPNFKHKAWGATILIALSGSVISFIYNDWMWLARFGALIVVLTTALASFNTHLEAQFVSDLLDEYFDPLREDL